MSRLSTILSLVVVAAVGVVFVGVAGTAAPEHLRPSAGGRLPIQGEGGTGASEQDFIGELVPVLERDTIPALDFPAYVDAVDTRSIVGMDELILGVDAGGEARAYPLRVMTAHEVVNDEIGGVPLVVTFCPLCFTGVAYDRRVGGETRTFGVSGYLLNSSLVMFDRERESLWSQVTGVALSGEDEDSLLTRISTTQTDLGTWLMIRPDTKILNVEALGGNDRYPVERFQNYFTSSAAGLIPLVVRDDLPEKALVAGLVVNGVATAFEIGPDERKVMNVDIGGENVVVWIDGAAPSAAAYRSPPATRIRIEDAGPDGHILLDERTQQRWRALDGHSIDAGADLEALDLTIAFWFGWAAFYPETALWRAAS